MKPYGAHMDSMAGPSILRAAMDPNGKIINRKTIPKVQPKYCILLY